MKERGPGKSRLQEEGQRKENAFEVEQNRQTKARRVESSKHVKGSSGGSSGLLSRCTVRQEGRPGSQGCITEGFAEPSQSLFFKILTHMGTLEQ